MKIYESESTIALIKEIIKVEELKTQQDAKRKARFRKKVMIFAALLFLQMSACATSGPQYQYGWTHYELENDDPRAEVALANAETDCTIRTDMNENTRGWVYKYYNSGFYIRCMKGHGFSRAREQVLPGGLTLSE